jgi:hypothetical protein
VGVLVDVVVAIKSVRSQEVEDLLRLLGGVEHTSGLRMSVYGLYRAHDVQDPTAWCPRLDDPRAVTRSRLRRPPRLPPDERDDVRPTRSADANSCRVSKPEDRSTPRFLERTCVQTSAGPLSHLSGPTQTGFLARQPAVGATNASQPAANSPTRCERGRGVVVSGKAERSTGQMLCALEAGSGKRVRVPSGKRRCAGWPLSYPWVFG